jgi:hypothetical protein
LRQSFVFCIAEHGSNRTSEIVKKLSKDWLISPPIDFEYQKYVVLAYLQGVQRHFDAHQLFPSLPDLGAHFQDVNQLCQSKQSMEALFPKNLQGIDLEKAKLTYQPLPESDYLTEIDSILQYALPLFSQTFDDGQTRYASIAAQLTIAPIGLIPLDLSEGYLFIYRTRTKQADVFQYQIKLYKSPNERAVQTQYVETISKSVVTTFENLKLNLVRQRRHLPNPATYLIESPIDYPLQETLLPISRRLLTNYTSA